MRKEFSLLGKTKNGNGRCTEAIFRNEQERKEFSLLGKTENGTGRCTRVHFRNGQARKDSHF